MEDELIEIIRLAKGVRSNHLNSYATRDACLAIMVLGGTLLDSSNKRPADVIIDEALAADEGQDNEVCPRCGGKGRGSLEDPYDSELCPECNDVPDSDPLGTPASDGETRIPKVRIQQGENRMTFDVGSSDMVVTLDEGSCCVIDLCAPLDDVAIHGMVNGVVFPLGCHAPEEKPESMWTKLEQRLNEHIADPSHCSAEESQECPECCGSGYAGDADGRIVDCPACEGTGMARETVHKDDAQEDGVMSTNGNKTNRIVTLIDDPRTRVKLGG